MQLVLIRHGIAENKAKFGARGQDDSLRPLTKEGRRTMARNARGLCRVIKGIRPGNVRGSIPVYPVACAAIGARSNQ
jgi:phosphohistidine phosphatase SixA